MIGKTANYRLQGEGWKMKLTRCFAMVVLTLALAGCGGSDSSGPKNADVSGVWTYNATNLQGSGGILCNVLGVTMTLAQNGTTFSGSYSGGTFSCNTGVNTPIGAGVVASGIVSGSNASFNMDSPDWANTGVVSGASISGTTTVRVGVNVATGNFAAVRR